MIRGNKRKVKDSAIPVSIDLNAKIHNRFDIEVRDAATGELKQTAQAFNVICDALWTRLFAPANYFNYIVYGGGTGTPAAGDTELFDRLNGVAVSGAVKNYDFANGVFSLRQQMQIDENTSVGDEITEVGIGYDNTHIVTHAMLQDMNGNPITIVKTDTDVITFYATVFVHFSVSGYQNGKIYVLANVLDGASAWRNTIFDQIAGNGLDREIGVQPCRGRILSTTDRKTINATLSAQNKTVSFSGLRWAVGEGNVLTDGYCLLTHAYGQYSSQYWTPNFYVDASLFGFSQWRISGESVGTGDGETADFATAFPVSSGATVYVDGVAASGVTVKTGAIDTYNVHSSTNSLLLPIDGNGFPVAAGASFGALADGYFENSGRIDSWQKDGSDAFEYSDDLAVWHPFVDGEVVTARYLHLVTRGYSFERHLYNTQGSTTNIHFQTPPPAGSVITIDYIPKCVPKDENHVFDLGFTLTLGEYSGV